MPKPRKPAHKASRTAKDMHSKNAETRRDAAEAMALFPRKPERKKVKK